jgi:DNA-binding NarL/FixJ family response regulator
MIKVILADDHRIFTEGLISVLRDSNDIEVIESVGNGEELLNSKFLKEAEVLILDITFPDASGLDLIEPLLERKSDLIIIMLSMHAEENFVRTALNRGAKGYVLKKSTTDELEEAIRRTYLGNLYYCREVTSLIMSGVGEGKGSQNHIDLTSREVEILQHIAKGETTSEIALVLSISINTVKTHRQNILEKLPVKNSAELVRFAIENDLLD